MNVKWVLENLCLYDERNPDRPEMDDEDVNDRAKRLAKDKNQCFCDNCFHGCSMLADELVERFDDREKNEMVDIIKNSRQNTNQLQ